MANEEAKLFVAGLPDSVSEDVLKQLFEATGGTVINVSLPKDRATGRPRGFGFVTLSTAAEAQTARGALDGSMQAGKSISVRPFQAEPPRRDGAAPGFAGGGYGSAGYGGQQPGGQAFGGPGRDGGFGAPSPGGGGFAGPRGPGGPAGAPDRTLYVGNLPYDCTQQEIEVLINGVAEGHVVRVHLPTDPDGRKRGFGFVTMASPETAKEAADALRTADLRGRRLIINLAHPKGERPARPEGGGFGGGFAGSGGYNGGGGFPSPGGGGGGGGGFPPAPSFGAPASAQRKTFDERRRKGGPGSNEDGPRKKRLEKDERGGARNEDWRTSGSDDD